MWSQIATRNRPVHNALLADDLVVLRGILADPSSSDLFFGIDNLARTLMANISRTAVPAAEQARHLMLLLAEAIGIRRWLPAGSEQEQNYYPPGHEPSPDMEIVVNALSEAMGFEIQFPNPFVGEVGFKTSRGIASYRAIQALYQCHRLQQELRGLKCQRVVEIGPGMGRTALYALAAGVMDYTTVDLPLGVVAQACFLGAVLGPDAIWMIGDPPALAKGRVRLLANGGKYIESEHFGVVLNVNSMSEMGTEGSANYARWIATAADIFLSINHEANGPLIADLGRQFFPNAAARRYPYWMRLGYVEEIFYLTNTASVLEAQLGALSTELALIRNSASWKLTAPLRSLLGVIRRGDG